MTDAELVAFYRRYNACCNEHRFEGLPEFVAREVIVNGTKRGIDEYGESLRTVVRAFPDYRWELGHLLTGAPWISVHLTDTGTHHGRYLGVEATGRPVRTEEFAFYRVESGRIAEVWGMDFHLQLLDQIRERRLP